ncbi:MULTISPECIES: hypothetical protein [unclassified Thioalkalivibrio]|uniref:HvfA family oxazolone/thioamide-modified RiPP metallophore n=1 Tax=unclassified Thioalkalivibrio TaxID=2621013 RepID=UPI000381F560|nr:MULTISPECIES: hypothetical protein [unclassified Thioalkalivibrio]
MKNDLFSTKTLAGAVGSAAIGMAMATSPVFASADLNHGYQQSGQSALMLAEGACGEGTCGGAAETKDNEGSCGEGTCGGASDTKDSEGSCGEGTCGGSGNDDKDSEGACGEGTCGG